MRRLALTCVFAIAACGDDSGSEESQGSNTADDSVSAGTEATDTGTVSVDDGGTTDGSASVSGSTSADDGSSGVADSGGSSGGADGTTSAAGSESGGDETFACGEALMCLVASQYCERTVGGAQGNPPQFQCLDLPEGCQPEPSCDCLADTGCGNMCVMAGAGLEVTCQAP